MSAAGAPDYSVPALDKALDILELLAGRSDGLSQAAIADAVGRSVSQVFRVLQTLEARGYLMREEQSGLYSLSIQIFELAHRQEPLRGLETAALPPMRAFVDDVQQSCNLGVLAAGRVLVLAQVESPANFGFRVRVGAEFPVDGTATGAVLAAFADLTAMEPWLTGLSELTRRRVDRIRVRKGVRQPPAGDHRHRVSDLRARTDGCRGTHRSLRRHELQRSTNAGN
ncbi:MAG: helix-turn-helix domain-containing protein [Microbacteriaceae bacterium]|nr:helix-turn-helix domain-containing protein [Microbacteriaceae bacterium]